MLRTVLLTSLALLVSLPAIAQGVSTVLQTINEYNRIPPLQNPEYERGTKILDRRISDRKNRVVGELNDVIYKDNGALKSLNVEFDRLKLSQPVYLGYYALKIKPASNSYQVNLDDKQIGSLYPELLAGIETAAGPGSEDLSLEKTIGSQARAEDGRQIGTVEDVLFSASGDRIEAVYIKLSAANVAGKSVAIPMDSVKLVNEGDKPTALLTNDVANAMIAYASGKK